MKGSKLPPSPSPPVYLLFLFLTLFEKCTRPFFAVRSGFREMDTSNLLFHSPPFGPFSAVSTPLFIFLALQNQFETATFCEQIEPVCRVPSRHCVRCLSNQPLRRAPSIRLTCHRPPSAENSYRTVLIDQIMDYRRCSTAKSSPMIHVVK